MSKTYHMIFVQIQNIFILKTKNSCNRIDYRSSLLMGKLYLRLASLLDSYRYSNCTTYHRVVTHAEEAHHFYVCGH